MSMVLIICLFSSDGNINGDMLIGKARHVKLMSSKKGLESLNYWINLRVSGQSGYFISVF
jgi:hypothetical protein